MNVIVNWRIFCCALLLGAAWPAHAYYDHFLNGTIVGTLGKDQTAELVGTFTKTLNEAEDGTAVPFTLSPNAKGKVTEGSITPVQTRTHAGLRCRQVSSELRQQGRQPERWKGWYCQQADGKWKKTLIKD